MPFDWFDRMVTSKSRRHWTLVVLFATQIGTGVSCSSSKTGDDAAAVGDAGDLDASIDGSGGPSLCAFASGHTFGSVTPMECGIGANGQVIPCTWTISFAPNGTYQWSHSDVGQVGTYHCEGQTLFMQPDNGTAIPVPFDRTTGHLTWQGVDYLIQP
jgi:hypothetical protein